MGPALNNAFNLDVTPGGHASVLDYTPMPSDNLRVRKIDAQGNVLRTMEQHGFDQGMFEFEDRLGRPVTFFALGGGPAGAHYKITQHAARPHEVIYEGHLPPGYYYVSLEVMGFDARGQVYVLRMIAPDITDLAERTSKTEVWADILDLERGAISSVRLEPDRRPYGCCSTPNHIYDVDLAGNIYQMQADEDELRIVKYSRR